MADLDVVDVPQPVGWCYRCGRDHPDLAEHLCQVTPRPVTAGQAVSSAVYSLLDALDVPHSGYSVAHAQLLDEAARHVTRWADMIRRELAQ